MKDQRKNKILQIICENVIQTQDELLSKLNAMGFNVTQATVSRDIRELKLIKLADSAGKYRYCTQSPTGGTGGSRFATMCSQNAMSADYAGNICVVRCMSGTANAVCACIDESDDPDIIGTIAGDDTIFVLMRTEDRAKNFYEKVSELIK